MKAYAPNGKQIVGSYEFCPCTAHIIEDDFCREDDGSLAFDDWAGGSDMHYNGQENASAFLGGEYIYVDEDGGAWPESSISLEGEPLRPEPPKNYTQIQRWRQMLPSIANYLEHTQELKSYAAVFRIIAEKLEVKSDG